MSWPGLSTSDDVDGRDKPDHDGGGADRCVRTIAGRLVLGDDQSAATILPPSHLNIEKAGVLRSPFLS